MAFFQKSSKAKEDLIDIWLYIAESNPLAATKLIEEFDEKGILLSDNPKLGQARPDINKDFRHFPVGNYIILYKEIPGGIRFVRVVQGKRLLKNL